MGAVAADSSPVFERHGRLAPGGAATIQSVRRLNHQSIAGMIALVASVLPLSPPVFSSRKISIGFIHHWGKAVEAALLYGPTGLGATVPSDAEITLAFVAKRQGTDLLPTSSWAHVLSLELGWMAPGAAKAFVADCHESGLLLNEGDNLRLGFDRKAVDIPNRYRPPGDMAPPPPSATVTDSAPAPSSSEPPDLFPTLVARIVEERDIRKDDVLDEVRTVQDRFGGRLSADAAIIHVALGHGLSVAEDAAAALARITSKST